MGSWKSFDRYAEEYDAWYEKYKPAYESELLALRAFLPKNPEKLKALEIGTGTGRFSSEAHFLSAAELSTYLLEIGFENLEVCQTLFRQPEKIESIEFSEEGYGKGSFVVLSAKKSVQ